MRGSLLRSLSQLRMKIIGSRTCVSVIFRIKLSVYLLLIFVFYHSAEAIAPAKPGVQVPQYIIDIMQEHPERYYPEPALKYTMARYAQAKRDAVKYGLDDPADVYGCFPVVCGKYSDSGGDAWPIGDMQQELFDGPWPTGTMNEFYEEISFDQFHLDGTVYGWFTTSLTQAYVVGSNYGMGPDAHLDEFLIQLLNWTDPTVDFGQYDNDGADGVPNSGDDDGFVDTMFFIHDGPGGETGANNIWSHSYSLYYLLNGNYYVTNDPSASGGNILIGPYIIQPAVNYFGGMIEIGVFCHEFGHALGLPDLYDTDYSSEGIGVWGLMSGGSWNTPAEPAHMIAWSRYQLGWIDPVEVTDFLHDQPITPIETTGEAYKLWTNGFYGNEYFIIENRQRYGSDVHLRGEGLMIWHIDQTAEQSNEDHPLVDLEEADGLDNLYYGTNSGDAGDLFPGASDNHWFDEYTYPSSLTYYNQSTQVAVWDISDEADTMYANLDVIYSQPRLLFEDLDIDDSAGNGDGRADPGETIDIWITVRNIWGDAEDLIGFLSTTSGYADIIDPTGVFGDLPSQQSGSNQSSPFQLLILPDAVEGDSLPLDVHFTGAGGFSQDICFSLFIGRPPVLLVDDDLGEDYEDFIVSSLSEIGAQFEVWDVEELGAPEDETMLYEAIIWMTGDDASNTLTYIDMSFLELFLDTGGILILTGQNINEDIGSSAFFSDYLHCAPNTNNVNLVTLEGVPENPISADMDLMIIGGTGAFNQTSPSSVIPQGIAEELFIYPNGEVGGISYVDPSTDAHLIFLAFGLEAVSGLSNTTTRSEFLIEAFQWAEIPAGVQNPTVGELPAEFIFKGVFPNPFNNTTEIRFRLPRDARLKVAVYNLLGREAAVLAEDIFNAGLNSIRWEADDLASGIYIVNISGGDFSEWRKVVLLK